MRATLATRASRAVAVACVATSFIIACTDLGGLTAENKDDASTGTDAAPGDELATGVDAASCNADLSTDARHCGRCGHDCLGGKCTGGKCSAFELGSVGLAPLANIVLSADHLFVSPGTLAQSTDEGGIWRVPKAGGAIERYVTLRYAAQAAISGDKLYFVVDDPAPNGDDPTGGLYACPLTGAAPCTATLIASAIGARAIAVDQGRIFYNDGDTSSGAPKGVMMYAPPAAPIAFRPKYGTMDNLFVEGDAVFYTTSISNLDDRTAKLIAVDPDGGPFQERYTYTSANAECGHLTTTPDSFFFGVYDFTGASTGVLRRIPRVNGVLACDLGGGGNKRPYGAYADTSRVYWTNQGEGVDPPFTGGSIATCPLAGCCVKPEILWTGDGAPTAIAGEESAIYFVTSSSSKVWKMAKP